MGKGVGPNIDRMENNANDFSNVLFPWWAGVSPGPGPGDEAQGVTPEPQPRAAPRQDAVSIHVHQVFPSTRSLVTKPRGDPLRAALKEDLLESGTLSPVEQSLGG